MEERNEMTTKELAAILGISPSVVQYHLRQGHITGRKEGIDPRSTWYVSRDAIEQYKQHRSQGLGARGLKPGQRRGPAKGHGGKPKKEIRDGA